MAGGPSITITINAENKAGPTVQEIRADFKGLAEEIAKAMEAANQKTEQSASKLGGIFKTALGGVLSAVQGIAGAIGSVFSGVVGVVGGILGGLVDVAKAVVSGIIGAFKLIPDALGLVFNKVTALGAAAFGFVALKLGEAGAQSEAMGQALERLAKKAGQSGDAIVSAIKRGSGETITQLDAMRVANQALIANLNLTPEKFEQLAGVADLLADAVGGDTAEAFEQLVKGIQSGNDKLLESVGIHVEVKKVLEDYANALLKTEQAGKKVQFLTERERKLALVKAAQEKVREDLSLLTKAEQDALTTTEKLTEKQRERGEVARSAIQIELDRAKATGDFSRILGEEFENEALAAAMHEKYGKAVKATADDLTEAQKSHAILNAVLEQSASLLKDAEGSADLLGDAYDRIAVLMKDGFTSAADAVRPALLSIAQAIEPILIATKEWIDANQALITSGISSFAEKLADGITRFAGRLPEIVELVRGGLSAAFDFAAKAGQVAWTVITDAIGGAMREVGIFREAFAGLMNGEGFSIEGSVLLQTFRVVKTQAKLAALEIAEAFTESFGSAAVSVANFVLGVRNSIAEAALYAKSAQNTASDIGDFFAGLFPLGSGREAKDDVARRDAESARRRAALAQAAIDLAPRGPLSQEQLLNGIGSSRSSAQAEADAALLQLGSVLQDVSDRGGQVREAATQGVERLKTSITGFFATDEERAARELQATEDAAAATASALESQAALSRALVEEQVRLKQRAESVRLEVEELRRQAKFGFEAGGVQAVAAGG